MNLRKLQTDFHMVYANIDPILLELLVLLEIMVYL